MAVPTPPAASPGALGLPLASPPHPCAPDEPLAALLSLEVRVRSSCQGPRGPGHMGAG